MLSLVIERQHWHCEATENRWTTYTLRLLSDAGRTTIQEADSLEALQPKAREWQRVLACPAPAVETHKRVQRDPF